MYTDDPYLYEAGGGWSRWLNGVTGGDSSVTFSAWSYFLAACVGSKWGKIRVACIDFFAGSGHCQDAHEWHVRRGFYPEPAMVIINAAVA